MGVSNGTVHLDASTLQFLVYTAIPFVVDLIGKRFADGRVKGALVGILALAAALGQEALSAGGDFVLADLIGKFVTALVTAAIAHKFVWEPLRLTGDRGIIQRNLPAGVGTKDPAKATWTASGRSEGSR